MKLVRALHERVMRHGLVLADQALVSGASFVTTMLLVRALGLDGFGRFSLAWMAVVFAQALQLACVGTPMATLGPKERPEDAPAYHADVLRLAAPDKGELVKLVKVNVSCHAPPACVDVTLDCQDGTACTTIDPMKSCTKQGPGCKSDDSFCN